MDLMRDISVEKLPRETDSGRSSREGSITLPTSSGIQLGDLQNMSEEEITEKLEVVLLDRIKQGDNIALFQLGQLYFEQEEYDKARSYFKRAVAKGDFQALFQVGVIEYDGLAGKPNYSEGFECMQKVAASTAKQHRHLVPAALYNVGRAFFQGYGVKQSDKEAERQWLLAADDGNPRASLKAQSSLGLYYTRTDSTDLKKAFFWHSEACGNGSLESQGALGVMYQNGLGCKKDEDAAFVCLREAAERGNVYAMGNLVSHYYRRKLYTKTVELAARVSQFDDVEQMAQETDCLAAFVAKGIALGCFYYARCLHLGLGVKQSEADAKTFYSRSYYFDPDVCAKLQSITQKGEI